MDVSGADPQQKLCILAGMAFGVGLDPAQVPYEGITALHPVDFKYGREMGFALKLVASAERWPGERWVCAGVRPCFVRLDSPLASVSGATNAVLAAGSAVGQVLLQGAGAGSAPTASSVVSDLLNITVGVEQAIFNGIAVHPDQVEPAPMVNPNDTISSFYLRFHAVDRPGVLAQVMAILGRHGVSVSGVLQHVSDPEQRVPVVITTHKCREGDLRLAAEAIAHIAAVGGEVPVVIRILGLT
jgi:homoserine dehydrogenase